MDIDFVIAWVDGSDKEWLDIKNKYQSGESSDDGIERYRDMNLVKYWFRGIEKFTPWVRKIHFITWGHIPEWLDKSHPKINIVRHEDYMPDEILPVFNSSVVELFLHRIPGLSEYFVYFNDDMFFLNELKEEHFFKNNKPVDMLAFQPVVANPDNPVMSGIYMNNSVIISKHFKKREQVKKHPWHYFRIGYPPLYFLYNMLELAFPLYTGFYTVHGPSPFLKSTYEKIWEFEEKTLMKAAHNRFRSPSDLTQCLFREWQMLEGNFVPQNMHKGFKYYEMNDDINDICNTISKRKKDIICINDTKYLENEDYVKERLHEAFKKVFLNKSSFER